MTINTVIKTILLIFVMFFLTVYNVNAAVMKVTGEVNYSEVWEALDIVNEYRAAEGLHPLVMDSVLMEAAMQRAAECSVYYSHTRPNGTDCFTLIEVREYAAENAAKDFEFPADAVAGWMNSEGHRKNIVSDKFHSIGIGVITVDGTRYWTQFFDSGTPRQAVKSTDVVSVTYTIDVNDMLINLNAIQNDTISFHGEKPFNGESVTISGIYTYLGDNQSYTESDYLLYESSNPNVATVDKNGVVRPVSAGDAVISIYLNGSVSVMVTYNVNVSEHVYTNWTILTQSDCSNNGTRLSYCEICREETTQVIPATGEHNYNKKSTIYEPSCYANGLSYLYCGNPNCNESYQIETSATDAHIYDSGIVTIAPTSVTKGIKTYTCTNSGCTASYSEYIPVLKTKSVLNKEASKEEVNLLLITEPTENAETDPNSDEQITDIAIEPQETPLASIDDVLKPFASENNTTSKSSVSNLIIPYILLIVIVANIVLAIILKRRNR